MQAISVLLFFFWLCMNFLCFSIFSINIQLQYIKLVIAIVLLTQEKIKDAYFANVKDKLRQFDTFLGDKPWFAGDGVSLYSDILFWLKKIPRCSRFSKHGIIQYYRSQFK